MSLWAQAVVAFAAGAAVVVAATLAGWRWVPSEKRRDQVAAVFSAFATLLGLTLVLAFAAVSVVVHLWPIAPLLSAVGLLWVSGLGFFAARYHVRTCGIVKDPPKGLP